MRSFWRDYFFKIVVGLVILQLGYFAWLEYRNEVPRTEQDEFTLLEGTSSKFNVLGNDKDNDEMDTISLVQFSKPLHGDLKQINGFFEYKPAKGFIGKDSIWYIVSDGKDESEKTYVKINVMPNLKPEAVNDSVVIYPFETASVSILENDKDQEGDSIFIKEHTNPQNGTITLNAETGQFHYIIKDASKDNDSFFYTLSDGKKTSTAKVYITVRKPEKVVFSKNSGVNSLENFQFRNSERWNIMEDEGNDRLGITKGGYPSPQILRLGEYVLVKNKAYKGNFSMTIKARSLEDLENSEWPDYAIVFAFKDDKNYCFAYFSKHAPQDGATGIYIIENGVRRTIAHGGLSFTDNKYHDAKVVRKGNRVTVSVDGKELVKADDKILATAGLVGFGSQDDRAYFDDFKVEGN